MIVSEGKKRRGHKKGTNNLILSAKKTPNWDNRLYVDKIFLMKQIQTGETNTVSKW